jgi:hypothetical protein
MDQEARQAYVELYGKEPAGTMLVRYHGNIKGYNASVRKHGFTTEFALSRSFEEVEPEIRIGVMQLLLNRLNKTKVRSEHIDFYNTFLKKMSDYAPVTKSDPQLEESFRRNNAKYFDGLMTQPNLIWGRESVRLLGTYTYATDTIMISQALREAPTEVLDSVMHHEMLHKKHKFNCTSGRTHSHTAAFRKEEATFEPRDIEERLHRWLRSYARRSRQAPTPARNKPTKAQDEPTIIQRVLDWF